MNSEKLLDAMEFIDEEYINNVYTLKTHPKSYKRNIIKYISVVACVVLALIGAVAIGLFDSSNKITLSPGYNNVDGNVADDSAADVPMLDDNTTDNVADDLNAGASANPNEDYTNETPSRPLQEEPTTLEEPTTTPEQPSNPNNEDEPTTLPEESTTEDAFCGVTRPMYAYVSVLYTYDNRIVFVVIDNKGNDELEYLKTYDMACNIYDDSDTNVKFGDKLNIMCAYDKDELVIYSIKK